MAIEISKELARAIIAMRAGQAWSERAKRWDGQPYSVFVSFSASDKDVAARVCAILLDLEVSHFNYVHNMNWGDDIAHRVKAAIADSTHLLLLATSTSQKSGWITYELGQAAALGKGILTFVPDTALQLNDVLKRHLCVTEYEAVRQFFSRPNINMEAVDDFLSEILGPLPVPLAQFVAQQSVADEVCGIRWRTPAVPPIVAKAASISLTGEEDDPKILLKLWTERTQSPELCFEYDDSVRGVTVSPSAGSGDRGVHLWRGDETPYERLFPNKHGWQTSRAFWMETVRRLRSILGSAKGDEKS